MKGGLVLVVQARTGSSRLPGKVLMKACGKALLELMLERLARVSTPARLVVATTVETRDDPIVNLCRSLGVEVFRGHPTDLLDRHYQAGVFFGAEAVAKIPSDCPLIDPYLVDLVVDRYNQGDCDYASNLHPASFPDGNDVEIMSMSALETAWREANMPMEREHTTPFIWERRERFRLANVLWKSDRAGASICDYSLSHRWTLDYPEDYDFVRGVYEELYPFNPSFDIVDILNLLERRPDIVNINSAYAGVNWYRNHLHELTTVDAQHTRPCPEISEAA